jgi:Uma2 family endonuclease
MSDVVKKPTAYPYGEIVAENVSEEDFLAHYEGYYEWIEGLVIKMSPGTFAHMRLSHYFNDLLRAYIRLKPIGQVFTEPPMMRLGRTLRSPDVFFVLADNPATFTKTLMIGVADLCIEIVSEESIDRDTKEKVTEYEMAGVKEYWIIDPLKQQALFYRLQADSRHYQAIEPDSNSDYETLILPKLKIHIPTLWEDKLPDMVDSLEALRPILMD